MASIGPEGLTVQEALSEALQDFRDATVAQHASDGTLEVSPEVAAEIAARHGLDEHQAIGACIVGRHEAILLIPGLTSLAEFTEATHGQ